MGLGLFEHSDVLTCIKVSDWSEVDNLLSPKRMRELLTDASIQPDSRLLVAVSGGADSLALLDLLVRVRDAMNLQLVACHINHELRDASVQEEARVRAYCSQRQVELVVRHWPVAAHPDAGTEAAARNFRYAQFVEVAHEEHCTIVLTAHHRDDQVETVLFRLLRSGSAQSVSGIQRERSLADLRLIRPLLSVTKAELRAYADYAELLYSDDASNWDTHFSRNYIRHELVPMMRREDAQADAHIARFAEEQAGLKALADVTMRHFLKLIGPKSDEFDWTPVHTESHAVQKLVLSSVLQQWRKTVTAKQVDAVLHALSMNDGVTRRLRLSNTLEITVQRLHVAKYVTPAPAVVTPACLQNFNQIYEYQGRQLVAVTASTGDGQILLTGTRLPLCVRPREPGDRMQLANGQHQLLRRWLINQHVPQSVRSGLIIIASGPDVQWIGTSDWKRLWRAPQTDRIKSLLVLR